MADYDDLLNNAPAEQDNGAPQLSKEEYAAKKQAERENLYELSDQTALDMAADGGKFQQYLDVQSTFDRYSAVNSLLILAQKPEATRIGSFDYWKNQHGFVKPGQTGISILEPGKEYERDDGSTAVGYNVKKVFDISQIDTRKLKLTPAPTYTERQLLGALISKAPVKITGVDEIPNGGGAMTDPNTGDVLVLKGMEFADTFRSVAFELAVADLTTGPDTQTDPAFSAYCASYVLCKKYGVDTKGFNFESAPVKFADMDAQAVKGELTQIRNATENISARMARQLGTQDKSAKSQDAR